MPSDEIEEKDTIGTDFSLADHERLEIRNPRLKKLYDYLSDTAKKSYSDPLLLSNSVFAKSDLPFVALENYLKGEEPERVSVLFSFKKLLHYFSKSLGWLVVFIAQSLAHKISRQKFVSTSTKSLILIDIYLSPEQIIQKGDLVDRFFPGLEEKLVSKGMNYAYAPKIIGTDNPLAHYKMFCLLKEKKRPVLSCFQILSLFDYFKMFVFILVYPFRVFRQIGSLEGSPEDKLLRFFLWNVMDHTTVKSYARQLFGKRISEMDITSSKCISWYENQPQDKNFYKGLRSLPGKVQIYGAQLYLWPATLLNLHADKVEINFGSIPDRILVNGTYYLKKDSALNYEIGPSMRYSKLFQTRVDAKDKTALIVLMPFFEYEIDKILQMIDDAKLSVDLYVKFHPATDPKKYVPRMKEKMQIVEDDIYALFDRVGCVIGKSTGALVEATSLGIPVINIETGMGISHNYLPAFGKGIIWQNASNGAEIEKWAKIFSDSLKTKSDLIRTIAEKHKEMFFCEPTSEKIDEAFGLHEPADKALI
jgi:hypothetical protein